MKRKRIEKKIDTFVEKSTFWIGSPVSLILHTLFFIVVLALPFFGFSLEKALLVLTTAVSLEAIYLALFIQMSINRNTEQLEAVEEDIEDIQEDIAELEESTDSEILREQQVDNEQKERISKIEDLLSELKNEIGTSKKQEY